MSIDYIDIFVKSPLNKSSSTGVLSLIILALGRIFPIITLAPFFGARILPHPVKVAFSLSLVFCVLPKLLLTVTGPLFFNVTLMMLFVKELMIGFIMGFFLGLPFLIVSTAGVFTDHQRGAASLMTNDPTIQNQTSPIGTLYNFVLIVLFFNLEGPFHVIDAIMDSYQIISPDEFLNPLFFAQTSLMKDKIYKALQVFIALSLQLCAPALIAMLMTDSFLGIINRLAPQVQITFLGMGLKSWLAILMVCIGWFFLVDQLGKQIQIWLQEFKALIPDFNYGNPIPTSGR